MGPGLLRFEGGEGGLIFGDIGRVEGNDNPDGLRRPDPVPGIQEHVPEHIQPGDTPLPKGEPGKGERDVPLPVLPGRGWPPGGG